MHLNASNVIQIINTISNIYDLLVPIVVFSYKVTIPCRYTGSSSSTSQPCSFTKLLNVCEYHDVLDLNKSICKRSHNLQGVEVIRSVKKYSFKIEVFDLDIFKIYLDGLKHTTCLFISDRFKKIMEENNITGLSLEKVYSI